MACKELSNFSSILLVANQSGINFDAAQDNKKLFFFNVKFTEDKFVLNFFRHKLIVCI